MIPAVHLTSSISCISDDASQTYKVRAHASSEAPLGVGQIYQAESRGATRLAYMTSLTTVAAYILESAGFDAPGWPLLRAL